MSKNGTLILFMGVNEVTYSLEMKVVCNDSCTTNSLEPLDKSVKNKFGITEGLMTTVHAMTINQHPVEDPQKEAKTRIAGRCAGYNIVPAAKGDAKTVGKVIPE